MWGGEPIVGKVIPGLVILGSVKKQTQQASKQYPSTVSALASASKFSALFEFLLQLPSVNVHDMEV